MKKSTLFLFFLTINLAGIFAQGLNAPPYKTNWSVNPFDHQLFVENLGQFDSELLSRQGKAQFMAQLGNVKAYFTAEGLVYRYDEFPKSEEAGSDEKEREREKEENNKPIVHYFSCIWEGANSTSQIETEDIQSFPYMYAIGLKETIKARVCKKITYRNLYPGIDLQYMFQPGKDGIKYNLIIHPGANLSLVKLKYRGDKGMVIDPSGKLVIKSQMGNFTESTPVCYLEENKEEIKISYRIENKQEVFILGQSYDGSKTLVIDPWITNPNFTGNNDKAYDVNFDNQGNVYAYGSLSPFQFVKLNSAGVIQWLFNTSGITDGFETFNFNNIYGDFALDRATGTSYLVDGCNNSGPMCMKINTLGTLVGSYFGHGPAPFYNSTTINELWRAEYDPCTHSVVTAGGGIKFTNQVTMLDTSMTTMIPWDALSTPDTYHDVSLLSLDPAGKTAYMLVDQVTSGPDPTFDNQLFSIPVPAMNPTTFYATNVDGFQELKSINYVSPGNGNGFNGMACSQKYLYIYDGQWLQQWDPFVCGCRVGQALLNSIPYLSGGVDVDNCGNVYVGNFTSAKVCNSAMALTSTIPLKDTVYDIALGANYSTLYACGRGFVSSTYLPLSTTKFDKTKTLSSCSCTGTANAALMICGAPAVGATYSWSNGQVGQNATGLCPGTYTVSASLNGPCTIGPPYVDTVTVFKSAAWPSIAKTSSPTNCISTTGSVTASVNGGTAPYTYSWSNGATAATISNLGIGNYCVTVKDANGCKDTVCVAITMQGKLAVTPSQTNLKCFGDNNGDATIATVTGGTAPFSYSWNTGPSSATISGLSAGTYTCVINDNTGGCTDTLKIILTQPTQLQLAASSSNVSCNKKCNGQIAITPSGATQPYSYTWSTAISTANSNSLCPGTYVITISDKNNCTQDTSIVITEPVPITFTESSTPTTCGKPNGTASVTVAGGTPSYSYSWSTSATTSGLNNVLSGTYTLSVKDQNGCLDSLQVVVPGTALFTLTSSPAKLACFGDKNGTLTVNVVGSSSPYSYSWSTGPTVNTINNLSAGIYTASVTDINGCVLTVIDTIIQPTQLALTSASQTACSGSSVTLTSLASGGTGPYTYLWKPVGGQTNGASLTDSPVTTTVYTLQTTDGNGCVVTQTDTIKINPVPTAGFGGTDVCVGVPTHFSDASSSIGGPVSAWVWSFGDGAGALVQNPTHTYGQTGTYTVSLTVSNGPCQNTTTHVVTVYALPTADFSPSPQPATVIDPRLTFTDLSKGGVTGHWYFGDLTDTTYIPGVNPTHTYPSDNLLGGENFIIKLHVVNQFGCADEITKTIHIDPEWTFYVPDAFSPNGDGLNDGFFGTGIGIVEKEMWVWDRWGLLIFHSTNLNDVWDGKVENGKSNEIVQQDVYVWRIEIKEVFGRWHRYLGHVTVVR